MMIQDGEIDRVLTLLRHRIRERGYTQLEVQKELGWGRSYISQLLTKQKALRVEQVLLILHVIGAEPATFFAELYPVADAGGAPPARQPYPLALDSSTHDSASWVAEPAKVYDPAGNSRDRQSLLDLRSLVRGLVGLLVDKGLIDLDDLTSAVKDSSSEAAPTELESQ